MPMNTTKLEYINRIVDENLSEDGDLELKGMFIGDEGLEALVLSKQVEKIVNLDLARNNITHK